MMAVLLAVKMAARAVEYSVWQLVDNLDQQSVPLKDVWTDSHLADPTA